MQLRWELSSETRSMLQRLRAAGIAVGPRVLQASRAAAQELADEVQMSVETKLKQRSGNLLRSVEGRAEIVGDAIHIRVGVVRGPAAPYAAQQEMGGRINAKPGHALPVPIGEGQSRTAVVKSPSQLPESIRRKLILIQRKGGKPPLLCMRTGRLTRSGFGKGAGLVPMYVLKKSVTLPATWWLHDPMEQFAPTLIPAAIDSALQDSLRETLA